MDELLQNIKSGDLDAVKYLVEECNVDVHAECERALRKSAEFGHLDIVKYLVEQCDANVYTRFPQSRLDCFAEECGANIHASDENSFTLSVKYGHLDIVKYFVEQCGANAHVNNERAFKMSAKYGHSDIVKYLIEQCGANVHTPNFKQ